MHVALLLMKILFISWSLLFVMATDSFHTSWLCVRWCKWQCISSKNQRVTVKDVWEGLGGRSQRTVYWWKYCVETCCHLAVISSFSWTLLWVRIFAII